MKQYKHRITDILVSKVRDYYEGIGCGHKIMIPDFLVEGCSDWIEIKEPLFTTDDGVPIYDNKQTVYCVSTASWTTSPYTAGQTCGPNVASKQYGWKYFSTKEARLEFIVQNKPVLTFRELKEMIEKDTHGWNTYISTLMDKVSEKIVEKLKQNDSHL